MPAVRLKFLCAVLAGIALAALPGIGMAAPNDEVFTVGSYPVDAQAANAVAAKQKAWPMVSRPLSARC